MTRRALPALAALLALAAATPAGAGAPAVVLLESPAEAPPRWQAAGVSGAILVHAGPADAYLAPHAPGPARVGFARTAHEAGAVAEAVWIVPAMPPAADGDLPGFRAHLVESGIPAAEAGTFAVEGRCFRGRIGALPVRACGPEGLPDLGGRPLLVAIDAAALPPAATARGTRILSAARELLLAIDARGYRPPEVAVFASVEDGLLPVGLRWVADALAALLRDPAPLALAQPPAPWRQLEEATRQLGSGERHVEFTVLDRLFKLHEEHPASAPLHYLLAFAYLEAGGADRSLETAEDACRIDAGYCFGLEELGIRLLERGRADAAAPFFAAGERMRPGMRYALLDKAIGLTRIGRAEPALAALDTLVDTSGPLPGAFIAGALRAQRGDRPGARRSFDAALGQLARLPEGAAVPGFSPPRLEVRMAAAFAARFYREEGLAAEAARLEADPRLGVPRGDDGGKP